ncbi:hypothetical protein ACH5RR_017871 [Cinchona calisaya]|uniref:Transposase n=1 Tax=Cinchona calisaya TaxID=153742 RepID=A0ABD2ZNJ6_9GENT
MATQMNRKSKKCWSELSLILAMAVVFDPWYKFQIVKFSYKKLYGDKTPEYYRECAKDFDTFESEDFVTSAQKIQLELYLDEARIDRNAQPDIDVLRFWKAHQYHYPEFFKMALDILAIPITTVASESAFSIEGQVLDQYRTLLKPDVVQTLICTRDWIFGNDEFTAFCVAGEWNRLAVVLMEFGE